MKKFEIPWIRRKVYFDKEELAKVLKGLNNNKASCSDSVVNKFS